MLRTILHYTLHLIAPLPLAHALFPKARALRAYLLMLCTMAVDADHLLADPVFDPDRCSVGFHPLHSHPAIACYALLALLPYKRLRLPWEMRPLGIGLLFHMLTDWQDYYAWKWIKELGGNAIQALLS